MEPDTERAGGIGTSEETPVPFEGASEFLLYQTEGGETRVHVRLFNGTVWLTQRLIAELYQKSVPTINGHIKNVYEEDELDPQATIRKFRIVQIEGDGSDCHSKFCLPFKKGLTS